MKDEDIEKAIDHMMLDEVEFMSPGDPRYKQLMQFQKKYGHMPPTARRVHLGSPGSTLAPRGAMKKNSLSEYIYQKLVAAHEHWTSPDYSDSVDDATMIGELEKQLEQEVEAALRAYKEWATH